MKFKALSVALAFAVPTMVNAFELLPLKEVREQVRFVELTDIEKVTLVEQAKLVLEQIYVNQHQKNEYYGVSPTADGHLDPIKTINDIAANVAHLSTAQLHTQLSQLFISQRDLHLNYTLPAPFGEHQSYLPFNFDRVTHNGDEFAVALSSVWGSFAARFPGQPVPQVGDLVVAYQGEPIAQAVKSRQAKSAGANPYAGFARTLNDMRFQSHRSTTLPQDDTVTVTLESASTGELYDVTVDWLLYHPVKIGGAAIAENTSDQAKNDSADNSPIINSDAQALLEILPQSAQTQSYYDGFELARDTEIQMGEIAPSPVSAWPANNRAPGGAYYFDTVNYKGQTIGYLNISTFAPQLNWVNELFGIRDVVAAAQNTTDALVIDVRNNGGGYVLLSEMLPQLFIPQETKAHDYRLLNSPLNQYIYTQTAYGQSEPEFAASLAEVAGTDTKYSRNVPLTPSFYANSFKQVYSKPVAVLSNARSYSATDLFVCGMQDNDAAVIYGEDPQTGAGGASVRTHSSFIADFGAPFAALPQDISIRSSYMQTVRFGHHVGQLIEDYGCIADVRVDRTQADIVTLNQTQQEKVLDGLLSQAKARASGTPLAADASGLAVSAEQLILPVRMKNTGLVRISVASSLFVEPITLTTQYVGVYGNERVYNLQLPAELAGLKGAATYLFLEGLDEGKQPLWNNKQLLRIN
ncbi:hypothetical protein PULV_b0526 [Pseudoalteromonas ulvae UL12]|uniref:S41 family peptidase n=1 Tax=Pseudoalteromonas ulvae TaxID=107327 RepID=UPI00186B86F4|nr:S41 family peptidase [Pseudoalteromonas ulvae]MBE0365846.1 hypothetical protein [Pseudoalteromonas ulvae UL12]